ncbi:hypothetical protein ACFL02_00430 [Planctomycetota bacterium]
MNKSTILFLIVVVSLGLSQNSWGQMGTAFTYQGKLNQGGSPTDGKYDFKFGLYDEPNEAGVQVGPTVTQEDVNVYDGRFTVRLDFGDVFDGQKRWLEIGVRKGELADPNVYNTLQPRQELTPTPYALYAMNSIWKVNGNDIYYDLGKVGVGEDILLERFEVAGGIMTEHKDQACEVEADSSSDLHWQSFTVGITGKLTRIDIYSAGNDGQNCTYNIYEGEGTGGILLHTDSIALDPGWCSDSLSTPIIVTEGVQYTLAFSLILELEYNSRDPYPGGRAGIDPGYDLCFRTYVSTGGRALAATAGGDVFLADNFAGRVGIGTTGPVGKLHVSTPSIYGDVLYDGGSGQDDLSVDPDSPYTDNIHRIYLVEVTDSDSDPDKFRWSDDSGATWSSDQLEMTTSWYDLSYGVRIKWDETDGHSDGNESQKDIWTWIVAHREDNALVVRDGKVGIGTSNPTWELEVANLTAGDGAESAVTADDSSGAVAAYSSTLGAPFDHFAGRVSLFADGTTMGLDLRSDGFNGDMRFYTGGHWPANERMRISSSGGIRLTSYRDDGLGSWEEGLYFVNNCNGLGPWSHAAIWADGVSGYNGELVFGVDGDSTNNLNGIQEAMRINQYGQVGIGTTSPGFRLEVKSSGYTDGMMVTSSDDDQLFRVRQNSDGSCGLYIGDSSGTSTVVLSGSGYTYFNAGNVGIGKTNPQHALDVAGRTRTEVLEITGGSDLAEPFDIVSADESEPGMVVCIDPDNPGELEISRVAYDRRVAGIISGAGGVNPGMLMGQKGSRADGSTPVALTGRAYCLVDASKEPIEPGDLLTTSDFAGHAMKVTDYAKAQGAIIGKAMSSLKEGQGLVLVLVTLQ